MTSNFVKYIGTHFERDILPIIPAGATLKAESKLTPDNLGKIPGRFYPQTGEWSGFSKWSTFKATQWDLERWQGWQDNGTVISIGLNTYVVHGFDIDINDEDVANWVTCIIIGVLGLPGAIRRRHGSARRVLFYLHEANTAPINKAKIAFEIRATGEKALVELLAQGQQVVIEGPHAKGAMHYWEGGVGLIAGLETLINNPINIDRVNNLLAVMRSLIGTDERFNFIAGKDVSGHDRGPGDLIDNLMSPHIAKDQPLLARAVRAIDLNNPIMDYDRWIDTLRAIKAACGGDHTFFTETVWPWICTQTVTHGSGPTTQERGIEWLEERWNSFHDSTFGAEYVYQTAQHFGFQEGIASVRASIFDGRPLPQIDATQIPGASTVDGSVALGNGAPIPSLPSGATEGPTLPTDTHRQLMRQFIAQYGRNWKWCVDSKRWYRYSEAQGIWEMNESILRARPES